MQTWYSDVSLVTFILLKKLLIVLIVSEHTDMAKWSSAMGMSLTYCHKTHFEFKMIAVPEIKSIFKCRNLGN